MNTLESDRFRRGWERLMEVDAEGGERVIESLQDVTPDLGRYVVEFASKRYTNGPCSTSGNASS